MQVLWCRTSVDLPGHAMRLVTRLLPCRQLFSLFSVDV